MQNELSFPQLRHQVITENKNGINFIIAASICWLLISTNWLMPYSMQNKALYTFFCTAPMMPLAFLLSKTFKTSWKIPNNPLNELGLWLNFAQLFYFPFVFIFFAQYPEQFVMAFAIIRGAHFFPYAWFYNTKSYAVMAGVISLGSALIGTMVKENPSAMVAGFITLCLWVLSFWIFADYKKAARKSI
ncbi:MAG: hypothetical protein HEP71_09775 [Roseivirga sp.]|nr:hypothetical protein [Roseivirga sp.]